MPFQNFHNLFIDQINELLSSEKQIAAALPAIISLTASSKLQDQIDLYLLEIKEHISHIEGIFNELKVIPTNLLSRPTAAMIEEIQEMIIQGGNSPIKDAALLAMIQRLAHYKIAVYGTARTFARHLNYHAMDPLQRALNQEGEMDRALTKLAEGGMFSTGINELALRSKAYV